MHLKAYKDARGLDAQERRTDGEICDGPGQWRYIDESGLV